MWTRQDLYGNLVCFANWKEIYDCRRQRILNESVEGRTREFSSRHTSGYFTGRQMPDRGGNSVWETSDNCGIEETLSTKKS